MAKVFGSVIPKQLPHQAAALMTFIVVFFPQVWEGEKLFCCHKMRNLNPLYNTVGQNTQFWPKTELQLLGLQGRDYLPGLHVLSLSVGINKRDKFKKKSCVKSQSVYVSATPKVSVLRKTQITYLYIPPTVKFSFFKKKLL